jgi:hypothetical protein
MQFSKGCPILNVFGDFYPDKQLTIITLKLQSHDKIERTAS